MKCKIYLTLNIQYSIYLFLTENQCEPVTRPNVGGANSYNPPFPLLLSLWFFCFCFSTFGMEQLAKFEGGVLKTNGDIASPSREFYRSVFLGEWGGGEDEKVNK